MALFTQEQADEAYASCDIKKTVEDDNPSVGLWCITFVCKGYTYILTYADTDLVMTSTPLQVKNYMITDLMANHDCLAEEPSCTTTEEPKV
jgi:hypothetical protein